MKRLGDYMGPAVGSKSPCVMCPVRALSFCGALLKEPAKNQQVFPDFPAQVHESALAQENIHLRGDTADDVYILCYGWAFRFFQLSDGRRQILSFLLPGDLFSAKTVFEETFHFSVNALTEVRFSRFSRTELKRTILANQDILESWAKFCTQENDDADELVTDLGQRNADERIAHLFLSLMDRLNMREVIRGQRYPFPLRQQHIADIMGLTSVHVGRVISAFRKANIVELSGGFLEVLNLTKLERIGRLK